VVAMVKHRDPEKKGRGRGLDKRRGDDSGALTKTGDFGQGIFSGSLKTEGGGNPGKGEHFEKTVRTMTYTEKGELEKKTNNGGGGKHLDGKGE